ELGLVPAGADPQVEPAAAHEVDRRRHLRNVRWMPEGRAGDERPEPDTRRGGRDGRERGEGLHGAQEAFGAAIAADLGAEVVRDPGGIEAERFGPDRGIEEAGPAERLPAGE